MHLSIRAHFDGRVIVPDEPLDMPVNEPLLVQVTQANPRSDAPADERQRAYERLVARAVSGLVIPDEALRRENLYEDR